MPLPVDLSILLVSGLAVGLAIAMFVGQAIGGAIGTLILAGRQRRPQPSEA